MTEPRDDLDAWLHKDVDPLRPAPGTFELIRKRARRRKARRALVSAASAGAAAAVIVAAVVALPKLVPSVLHQQPSHPAANARSAPATPGGHSTGSRPGPGGSATPSAALPLVPANFAATSATFVGLETGWVIGQAGIPGHCYTQYCTSMARTDNAGKTWYGLHAPLTGPPNGDAGVSQVRFLDTQDGWAFGPQLWATHDGGQTWTAVPTGGMRVTSLETAGSTAFAVFARCTGSGPDFAAGCTQFFLYSSPAGSNSWSRVPAVAGVTVASGSAGSATIVLTAQQGYWYRPDGVLMSGPVTGTAPWTAVSPSALPCVPGPAQPGGRPSAGQLAAAAAGDLVLGCPASSPAGAANQQLTETVYASSDGGATWHQRSQLSVAGTVTSLAAGSGGELVLGYAGGIDVSADNGVTWEQAMHGPAGGFSYVGLTSPSQGVAVPGDSGQDAVWFTFDGGLTWLRSAITNG